MRPRSHSRSSRRSVPWGFATVFLLLLTVGVATTAWAAGLFDVSKPAAPNREGMLAYPVPLRGIPAYTAITREHLMNSQSMEMSVVWLKPESVTPAMIRSYGQLLGRVVARDKTAGLVFTEADLLPKGTRPGLTAGIPPGKRSLTVAVDQISGLENLRRGDRFDLFAALPPRELSQTASGIEVARLLGGIKPPDTRGGQLSRQAGAKLLVSDGMMVALTQGTQMSTQGKQGLTVPPTAARNAKVQQTEATLAVDPSEVEPLTEALSLDVKVYCVAHSGQPGHTVPEAPSLDGLIAVPAAVRPIAAFSAISAEDLADAVTGKLNQFYFQPEVVQDGWLRDLPVLMGRVVRRPIAVGEILTEADLLPVGTLPGVASAIPPGKVGVTAAISAIDGFSQLHTGSYLDLVCPIDGAAPELLPQVDWATLHGGRLTPEEADLHSQVRNRVRIVARQALKLPGPTASDAILAVSPSEATAVMQILQQQRKLYAVAHPVPSPKQVQEQPQNLGPAVDRGRGVTIQQAAFQAEPPPANEQRFPILTRTVRLGARLSLEDFLDPATGQVRQYYFPAENIEENWIGDLRKLLDRVAATDLNPGYVVRQADLLPPGTRPSKMAGIPIGEVAFTITSDQVEGLTQLQPQDRVLIVSASALPLTGPLRSTLRGENLKEQLAGVAGLGQSLVDRLVANGTVVFVNQREVKVPYEARTVSEGAWGRETRTETKFENVALHEVVLSLAPDEISLLTAALADGEKLFAVARSGNAGDQTPPPQLLGSAPELERYISIEQWRGDARRAGHEVWMKSPAIPQALAPGQWPGGRARSNRGDGTDRP